MSYLFKRIHDLLRKGQSDQFEDLLTELFAEVLEDEDKLQGFAGTFFGIKAKQIQDIVITTQKTFLKLDGHDTDSRPDIVLRFNDSDNKYVVFFENKINAAEGQEQLKRYAEHLKWYQDNGYKTILLYITRYADPKSEEEIFANGKTAIFQQLRWYKIYYWLKEEQDNAYIKKLLEFMEEIGLDESRRFLPQDMYAMQNMDRLQRIMDECLDDVVDEEMTKLFGKAIAWSNRNKQIRDYNRYFKVLDANTVWMGYGLDFNSDEYPQVQVMYSVGNTHPQRDKLLHAMNEFVGKNGDWEGVALNTDEKWQAICAGKSLLEFLHNEDHISSIQQFFIEKLRELHKLKQDEPKLFWK